MGAFFVTPSDTLGYLHLSAHSGNGRQPLRKPGKHAADTDTGHGL